MTFSREHLKVNQGFHKREPPRRLAIMKAKWRSHAACA